MWPNLQETADLVTFTEEIPNGKLYFLRSEFNYYPTIWIFYSHSLSNKIRRWFIMINSQNLMSYWSNIILSLYIIEILNILKFRCTWLLWHVSRSNDWNFSTKRKEPLSSETNIKFMAHPIEWIRICVVFRA